MNFPDGPIPTYFAISGSSHIEVYEKLQHALSIIKIAQNELMANYLYHDSVSAIDMARVAALIPNGFSEGLEGINLSIPPVCLARDQLEKQINEAPSLTDKISTSCDGIVKIDLWPALKNGNMFIGQALTHSYFIRPLLQAIDFGTDSYREINYYDFHRSFKSDETSTRHDNVPFTMFSEVSPHEDRFFDPKTYKQVTLEARDDHRLHAAAFTYVAKHITTQGYDFIIKKQRLGTIFDDTDLNNLLDAPLEWSLSPKGSRFIKAVSEIIKPAVGKRIPVAKIFQPLKHILTKKELLTLQQD